MVLTICWKRVYRNVTVQIDLENIPDNWEEILHKCGLLKSNCFAAVFEKYFEFQVDMLHHLLKHIQFIWSVERERLASSKL